MTRSTSLAKSAGASPKLTVTPSAPPKIAVAIPSLYPPDAVTKNTAGKYGMKNTSGRISERPHRAAVAKARQEAANPMLKSGDGSDVPSQPRRNSSINFTMGYITSADGLIQNNANRSKNTRSAALPQRKIACVVP